MAADLLDAPPPAAFKGMVHGMLTVQGNEHLLALLVGRYSSPYVTVPDLYRNCLGLCQDCRCEAVSSSINNSHKDSACLLELDVVSLPCHVEAVLRVGSGAKAVQSFTLLLEVPAVKCL